MKNFILKSSVKNGSVDCMGYKGIVFYFDKHHTLQPITVLARYQDRIMSVRFTMKNGKITKKEYRTITKEFPPAKLKAFKSFTSDTVMQNNLFNDWLAYIVEGRNIPYFNMNHLGIQNPLNEVDIRRIYPIIAKAGSNIEKFEKISTLAHKHDFDLCDLKVYMKKSKHPKFVRFDNFFKKVHLEIRKKALKSDTFKSLINSLIETNTKSKDGIRMTFQEAKKAYERLLDIYDPNVNNTNLTWLGFWSLIQTRKGEIVNIDLYDTEDVELFYKELNSIQKNKKSKLK